MSCAMRRATAGDRATLTTSGAFAASPLSFAAWLWSAMKSETCPTVPLLLSVPTGSDNDEGLEEDEEDEEDEEEESEEEDEEASGDPSSVSSATPLPSRALM